MNRHRPFATLTLAIAIGTAMGCTHFIVNDSADRGAASSLTTDVNSATGQQLRQSSPRRQNFAVNNAFTPTATANSVDCTGASPAGHNLFINDEGTKKESMNIRVVGYGAPPKAFYPEPQRRLMAMRAAKIDAYRSLAERVMGVQIWGGTTIGDMVVEKDRFRVYLDTHLRGARVIAENPSEDGTYETTVELNVGQDFIRGAQMSQALAKVDPCANNRIPVRNSPNNMNFEDGIIPVNIRANGMTADGNDFYFDE